MSDISDTKRYKTIAEKATHSGKKYGTISVCWMQDRRRRWPVINTAAAGGSIMKNQVKVNMPDTCESLNRVTNALRTAWAAALKIPGVITREGYQGMRIPVTREIQRANVGCGIAEHAWECDMGHGEEATRSLQRAAKLGADECVAWCAVAVNDTPETRNRAEAITKARRVLFPEWHEPGMAAFEDRYVERLEECLARPISEDR